MTSWTANEGSPFPLGATWISSQQAYNFALYSKHAHAVTLLLYREDNLDSPAFQYSFDFLENKSGPIWHCRIPVAQTNNARLYAYRIDGPSPGPGFGRHAFDPEKLLLDPYARDVFYPATFDREAACRPGSNEGKAPLGVLDAVKCVFDWDDD